MTCPFKKQNPHRHLAIASIIGIIFVSILGVLFHFTYKWSHNNLLVGFISATNESTWEHMKLLYFPTAFYILASVDYLESKYPNYLYSYFLWLLIGLLSIPVIFYTYTGILGKSFVPIDICIFFISIIITFFGGYHSTIAQFPNHKIANALLIIITLALGLCFIIFTVYPPNIGLFYPAN